MNQKFPIKLHFNMLRNNMYRLCVILIVMLPLAVGAQGLKVKDMKRVLSDLSASVHERIDSSGIPCGLVKVLMNGNNIDFGSHVVGKVDNRMNEYWVYLPKGSKELIIQRENFLPKRILFNDYGISEIESKVTYELTLKETSFNKEKNSLVINVKPQNAIVRIDDMMIKQQSNGTYKIFLEKGEHICRFDATGYQSNMEIVETGKELKKIDVELESLMANVVISSELATAEIYINNERKGVGEWKGQIPAGNYIIEARLEGYVSASQNISVAERESISFQLPRLQRKIVKINIKPNFVDCCKNVYIDGRLYIPDSTNCIEILSGKHQLKVEALGCYPYIKNFEATGKPVDSLNIYLRPINAIYRRAYEGSVSDQFEAGYKNSFYWRSQELRDEARYWFDRVLYSKDSARDGVVCSKISELFEFYSKENDARDSFEQLASILENNLSDEWPNRYIYVGECYEAIGKLDKAIVFYQKYCNSDNYNVPVESDILAKIGDLYRQLRNYERAKTYLLKAEKMYPGHGESLGDYYYEIGNRRQAIIWYKKRLRELIKSGGGNVLNNFIEKMKAKGLYDGVLKGESIPIELLTGKG